MNGTNDDAAPGSPQNPKGITRSPMQLIAMAKLLARLAAYEDVEKERQIKRDHDTRNFK